MDLKKFNASWQATIGSNRFLTMAVFALSICLLLAMVTISKDKERIVITPPHLGNQMVIAWDEASPEYYKSVAHWLSGTIGSVNEGNLEFTRKAVEQFFEPGLRQDLLAKLTKIAKDPLRKIAGAQVWFEAKELLWEKETSKVFVLGNLASLSANEKSPTYDPVTYEYQIKMVDGLPKVALFTSYRGPARTIRWMKENEFMGMGSDKTKKAIDEETARQAAEGEL